MPTFRKKRLLSRTLMSLVAGVVVVAACDTTASFSPSQQRWGFVYLAALRSAGGEYRIAPTAYFFRGSVTSVPDARVRTDSCFVAGEYVAPTSGGINGATYLDAGASITATLGSSANVIPRISGSSATTYGLASGVTVAHRPGDSVVVTVPGASGGFPASELRGRSAEPFTIDPILPSTNAIPLRWTAATDNNSALLVSLQYTPSTAGAKTQEIRCAFTDDGLDSIPARQHLAWSAASNRDRAIVVTRLRTAFVNVEGGVMELISTLQLPTPTP